MNLVWRNEKFPLKWKSREKHLDVHKTLPFLLSFSIDFSSKLFSKDILKIFLGKKCTQLSDCYAYWNVWNLLKWKLFKNIVHFHSNSMDIVRNFQMDNIIFPGQNNSIKIKKKKPGRLYISRQFGVK